MTIEKVLVTADYQVPYQDNQALRAVRKYANDFLPDVWINLGDLADFPGLTDKFTRGWEHRAKLPKHLEMAQDEVILDCMSAPGVEYILIEGNHEARLTSYIRNRAPEVASLVEEGQILSVGQLLRINKLNFNARYIGPYPTAYEHRGLTFKHGERVGDNPAKSEFVKEGSSGISGHVHRLGVHAQTNRGGAHAWYSIPTLCNVEGDNIPPGDGLGIRNQQQGFAVVYIDTETEQFNVYPIVIVHGKFISPEGKEYSG